MWQSTNRRRPPVSRCSAVSLRKYQRKTQSKFPSARSLPVFPRAGERAPGLARRRAAAEPPAPLPSPAALPRRCQTAGPREPALFVRAFQLSRRSAPRGPSRLYSNARRAGTAPPHPHGPPFLVRTGSGRASAEVLSGKVGLVEGARRLPWDPGAFPTSRSTNTRRARGHSRQRGPSWGRGGRDPGGDRLPADLP